MNNFSSTCKRNISLAESKNSSMRNWDEKLHKRVGFLIRDWNAVEWLTLECDENTAKILILHILLTELSKLLTKEFQVSNKLVSSENTRKIR